MLHLSAGVDEARSLTVEFTAAFRGVHVSIDNRWSNTEGEHYNGEARITQADFEALVDRLETDCGRSFQPPDMSEQELGVGYSLPLDSGMVMGGAHDFVAGISPSVLADAVLEFVHDVQTRSSFQVLAEDEFTWRSERPAPRRPLGLWLLAGNLASVAALAGLASFLLLT